MTPQKLDDVTAYMRARFGEEANSGFPKLSRVPSSSTIRFLDYYASLTAADQTSLLASTARLAAMRFFPALHQQMLATIETDPPLLAKRDAMRSPWFGMGLRYEGLRMRKAMLSDPMSVEMMAKTRATLPFTPRDDMPAALVPDPDPTHLKPAKAPQLRTLINDAFKRLFPHQKQKQPGGEIKYTGALQQTTITVSINFAGMGMQLLYGVSIPDDTHRILVVRTAWEDMWGAGHGWDYLTEENAETSIQLLCELVTEVVTLRNAVADLLGPAVPTA